MASNIMVARKAVRFVNDAAGLEKTLRLVQSIVQVVAAWSVTANDAAPWLQARKQLALGRRYLRFVKFIDAFSLAGKAFQDSTGLHTLLEVGKWSCLGMYLMLESTTIVDAMGIWTTNWAPVVFAESMKFWFYSLTFSVMSGLSQLAELHMVVDKGQDKPREAVEKSMQLSGKQLADIESKEKRSKQRRLIRKVVTDLCDLTIPGATTGWIITSSGTVGIASAISTVLASSDIWERI